MDERASASPEAVARAFAAALDHDDFESAARWLADDCLYLARSGPIVGPANVMASYREASTWAKEHLDAIRYESSVHAGPAAGRVSVTFVDHIDHRGVQHTYRCMQRLSVSTAGRIVHIEHLELPGQREALTSFLSSAGLARS